MDDKQLRNFLSAQYIPKEGELDTKPIPYAQRDPKGLDAKQPGAKLDAGKSPVFRGLLDYFPRACLAVAEVSDRGAKKYTWKGWEQVDDGVNRYFDAMVRHIATESIEGKRDSETGLYHKAQIAWNALAALELFLREQEKEHVKLPG